jgi:hypothetical protein
LRRHPHTAKASPTSVSRNLKKIKIMEKSESLKTEERQEKKKMKVDGTKWRKQS